jgi:uncharacterized protein
MPLSVAEKVIDFIFKRSVLNDEEIDIGFFGGEPLLQFGQIKKIISLIENHPLYQSERVNLSIVTNGTILNSKIIDYIREHRISFGISCDGPPQIHDRFRRTKSGRKTSDIVEKNIKKAKKAFSNVMVNAVYHPDTYKQLPQTIRYFASLGVKQIYLNPDFSALWSQEDILSIQDVYDEIGVVYTQHYLEENPLFVSLIDSKISVILRGGYRPVDRCRMGKGEFAFTPTGDIYPCERLVGDGQNDHCIGNVMNNLCHSTNQCHTASEGEINTECSSCSIKEYCMNWCGCSNYMATGLYNRVSSFLCASEKAAIKTSFEVFQNIENQIGPTFYQHAGGHMLANSISEP